MAAKAIRCVCREAKAKHTWDVHQVDLSWALDKMSSPPVCGRGHPLKVREYTRGGTYLRCLPCSRSYDWKEILA